MILINQESWTTQPSNPVNPGSKEGSKGDPSIPFVTGNETISGLGTGIVDKTSVGRYNVSDTSEQRSGEDINFNTSHGPKGASDLGGKSGSESLVDSIERSVHERGAAEHSRAV